MYWISIKSLQKTKQTTISSYSGLMRIEASKRQWVDVRSKLKIKIFCGIFCFELSDRAQKNTMEWNYKSKYQQKRQREKRIQKFLCTEKKNRSILSVCVRNPLKINWILKQWKNPDYLNHLIELQFTFIFFYCRNEKKLNQEYEKKKKMHF